MQADLIVKSIQGWPGTPTHDAPNASQLKSCSAVLQDLLAKGLLTTNPVSGKTAAVLPWNVPSSEINVNNGAVQGAITAADGVDFLRAVVCAWSMLAFSSLERTIERVRLRNSVSNGLPAVADATVIAPHLAAFVKLRPYVFAAHDACLFECLALSEFLAFKGILANWVFAIQFEPFAAHCWLQLGSMVLNDSVESVTQFNPIMIV